MRVLRGGSWNNNPWKVRSANRNRDTATNRNNNTGFRVASTPPCQSFDGHGHRGRAEGAFRDCHDDKEPVRRIAASPTAPALARSRAAGADFLAPCAFMPEQSMWRRL
ncbi:MAG: hypothetical protein SGJ03_05995 [Alphaproteobacteria bacterium]|nr:hypothetical protein [Alphaproteobacteria bacterium]